MRNFYIEYKDNEFLQSLVAEISWTKINFLGHFQKVTIKLKWKIMLNIFTAGTKCDISRVIYLVHFVLIFYSI